jgi:hypothetical protein
MGIDERQDPGAAACRPPDLSTICTPCHEGKGKQVKMMPVHSHYQCPECGWRDSCCM